MNRGFLNVWLVIALVVVIAGGAGYWTLMKQPSVPATSATPNLPTVQQNANIGSQAVKNPPPPTPVATDPSYVDSTFGISFQYPKGFIETKKQAIWTSKEAYLAWQNSHASDGRGGGVNNIVSFDDGNDAGLRIIILSVGTLNDYNSAADGIMYNPETDQSFLVNGVKVYKASRGRNADFYWQNTHKPSLETLWNAISIDGPSATEVSPIAALIQGTLLIK